MNIQLKVESKKLTIVHKIKYIKDANVDVEYSREVGKQVYCGNKAVQTFLRTRHV